jgi:hypothetical protein
MTIDFREAARRIKKIGNWFMLIGVSLVVISLMIMAFSNPSGFLNARVSLGIYDIVLVLLPGIAIRLLAWVVDGLAGPSNHEVTQPASPPSEHSL